MDLRVFALDAQTARLKADFAGAVASIKSELNDHRDAINQNAAEQQLNHEYLSELDVKIEKLAERVDELCAMLGRRVTLDLSGVRLTKTEQEVVTTMLALEGPVTAEQVGRASGVSRQQAGQLLYNLQLKGVPLLARNLDGELFYSIDLKFKDLQLRKNVLRLPTVRM